VTDRHYHQVMTACLLVVFASAFANDPWPQARWLTTSLAVAAGIVALVTLIAARRQANQNREDNRSTDDERSAEDTRTASTEASPRTESSVPTEGARDRWRLMSFDEISKHDVSATYDTYLRTLLSDDISKDYRHLYLTSLLKLRSGRWSKLPFSEPPPSDMLVPLVHALLQAQADSATVGALKGRWARSPVQQSPIQHLQGRFLVTIGPVTIEIAEDETRVHVASAKGAVTTVTTDKPAAERSGMRRPATTLH
jgi:hypothetical protein